jgi:hypothetical protein
VKQRTDVGPDAIPILLDLSLDIYLVDPKAFRDAKGLCGSAIE